MTKLSLTKKFTVFLFSLIFSLGVLLNFGIAKIIESHTLKLIASVTGNYVHDILRSSISSDIFTRPLKPEDHRYLDQVLSRDAFVHSLISIEMWDKDGKLVYSHSKQGAENRFSNENGLKQAMQGKMFIEVTNSNDEEHKGNNSKPLKLINIYSPILGHNSDKVLGTYEIHWDFSDVTDSIRHAYKYIWLMLSLTFTLIYLSLYAAIKSTSKTLDNQFKAIKTLSGRLKQTLEEKLSTLIAALDAKDNYTAGHSLRVADYSLKIGRAIGMQKDKLKLLEQAALLHDIGKIGVPEQVLNKPGFLTDEEFSIIKQHPSTGAYIVQQSTMLSSMGEIIRHHHERYDGQGYPDGLKGEEIPLESRIMAVADTFDAMTTDRPYRAGVPIDKALEIMNEVRGSQLDAKLVERFIEIIRTGK